MTNLDNPIASQYFPLYRRFGKDDLSFSIKGRFTKDLVVTEPDKYLIGKQVLTLLTGDQTTEEVLYIDVSTEPSYDAEVDVTTYTLAQLTDRGLPNDTDVNGGDGIESKRKSHAAGTIVSIGIHPLYFKQLKNAFAEGATEFVAIAGEAIGARKAVAIDQTDGELYLFDDGNANHTLVGISKDTYAENDSATYVTTGGTVTGFSGLTLGANYYADEATAGDLTTTANDYPVGNANSDGTQLNVAILPPVSPIPAQDQATWNTGTSTTESSITPAKLKGVIDTNVSRNEISLPVIGGASAGDAICRVNAGFSTNAVTPLVQIGRFANSEYAAIPFIGNGVSANNITIAVSKQSSPIDSLEVRIETSSGFRPTGTLVDPNAITSITGSSLTPGDETFTFPGSFSCPNGEVCWIILQRTGALDSSNFYYLSGGSAGPFSSNSYLSAIHIYNSDTENDYGVYTSGTNAQRAKITFASSTNTQYNIKCLPFIDPDAIVGFAQDTVSAGSDSTILTDGVDKNQSGLVQLNSYGFGEVTTVGAGEFYTVDEGKIKTDGTLGFIEGLSYSDTEFRIKSSTY